MSLCVSIEVAFVRYESGLFSVLFLDFNDSFHEACFWQCISVSISMYVSVEVDRKKHPPLGGFPIYYVPSSRTVCKRTPLEGFVPCSSRGVLLHTVLDEGT